MGALAQQMRRHVASVGAEQRRDLTAEAVQTLMEVNRAQATGGWSKDVSQAMTVAVEMIVQIESFEKKKGTWYRLRRRAELIGLYVGPNAFFKTPREITVDAAHLKFACDISMERYFPLEADALRAAIVRDFPQNQGAIKRDEVTFVYPQASDFLLGIRLDGIDGRRSLNVSGHGKYQGFLLFLTENYGSSHVGGRYYAPTPAARELVRTMEKNYGIKDNSAFMARANGR